MTELEIMLAVANNPKVRAYREAVQLMHRRMTYRYGSDYACQFIPTSNLDWTGTGVTRMSPLDRARFDSLMRGAARVRRDVRASLLASV